MTSIHNNPKKIKLLQVFLLVVLMALGIIAAFVLGRLSALQNSPKTVLSIQKAACPIPAEIAGKQADMGLETIMENNALGSFVASKNGTKFYPADCSYADRILDANKIWFDTEDDAIAAGYAASSQCSS